MFWTGFIVGLFVGANVGTIVAAMLYHAKHRAKKDDRGLIRYKHNLDKPLEHASDRGRIINSTKSNVKSS